MSLLASILSYSQQGAERFCIRDALNLGTGIGAQLILFSTSIGLISRLGSVARWWEIVHWVSGVILVGLGLYLWWKA